MQRTLSIIKPDAMQAGKAGEIIAMLQSKGFAIVALRRLRLTKQQAEGFYQVHRERSFFDELSTFMSQGPIIVMALEAEEAITKYREVIGVTDPEKAAPGTIRQLFGTDVQQNAVHGSDGPATAATEIAYFFAGYELIC